MQAIVAERGQVTIPKPLRDRLGIRPQTVLEFQEDHGRLIVEKALLADPVAQVIGCLNVDEPTDQIMDALRGDR
jgi:antitoxin PrlF